MNFTIPRIVFARSKPKRFKQRATAVIAQRHLFGGTFNPSQSGETSGVLGRGVFGKMTIGKE